MKELTGNQIRQMFLDYFASKGGINVNGYRAVDD